MHKVNVWITVYKVCGGGGGGGGDAKKRAIYKIVQIIFSKLSRIFKHICTFPPLLDNSLSVSSILGLVVLFSPVPPGAGEIRPPDTFQGRA